MAVFPERVDAGIDAVEQRLVRPFEIEHQADGLTHPDVLKFCPPQVEDKGLAAGQRAVRRRVLDRPAFLDGGEVIAGGPDF